MVRWSTIIVTYAIRPVFNRRPRRLQMTHYPMCRIQTQIGMNLSWDATMQVL